jgi:hypothetical protein
MLQIANDVRPKLTRHGRMLLRIVAGVAVAMLVVGVQALAFGEAPIRFAPSLLVVALGTWYWGYQLGISSLLTSAVLINLALLHPRGTWSTHPHALTATALHLMIGLVMLVSIETLRARLSKLERALAHAHRASESEVQTLRHREGEFGQKLAELHRQCAKVLDLAQASATNERRAANMTRQLEQLSGAIEEIPFPMALFELEPEMLEIGSLRAASRSFLGWAQATGLRRAPEVEAFNRIVMPTGHAYPLGEHPIVNALRGIAAFGLPIGWRSSNGLVSAADLYAIAIAQGRMLALAVIPRLEPHDPAQAN